MVFIERSRLAMALIQLLRQSLCQHTAITLNNNPNNLFNILIKAWYLKNQIKMINQLNSVINKIFLMIKRTKMPKKI